MFWEGGWHWLQSGLIKFLEAVIIVEGASIVYSLGLYIYINLTIVGCYLLRFYYKL